MDNDLTTKVEKLMRGFINLEKGLSNIGSRSEAMEKETYELLERMVQRINAHKGTVDTLAGTVNDLQQQLQKLTIMVNDLALKAKEAESKTKRAPRKKATVEDTPAVAPVQPTAPVGPAQSWDGVEFPIVRDGMEITPPVIARCRMCEIDNKGRPSDIPEGVWTFLSGLTVDDRMHILKLYGVEPPSPANKLLDDVDPPVYPETDDNPTDKSESVDQVLTAINTGD